MVLRGYDHDRERWARLHDELRTIERLGYPSYFLTVAQVVDDIREMGIGSRPAGPAPAPWSTTSWASHTPIRSSTGC